MTVDPKLTALLVTVFLVMAAPVAAHHKEGHTQGNTDEKAQQDPDSQDRGPDGSQDQARGPPDHAQGGQHAQSSLPGEETSTDEDEGTTGATDDTSATDDGQTSEEGSTTDSTAGDTSDGTDDGTATDAGSSDPTGEDTSTQSDDTGTIDDTQVDDTQAPEDTTVADADPTTTFETQETEQTPEPAPGLPEAEGTAVDEPTTTGSGTGSQAAFTGRLTPTTGQPLAADSLDGDQASQAQDTGIQAPGGQAPGWDLAPLILIGLAALTGGGMATLRRQDRQQEQTPPTSAATPGPAQPSGTTETTDTPEPSDTSGQGPAPHLPPGAPAVLELAQEAVGRQDYQGAIGWFETAIALQPDLPVAHLCLGVCLAELGRDEEALESLGHAADLAPGDPVPVFHQARILARTGRTQEALEPLARVVPVLPDEMVEALAEDEAFSSLADHPRFLALIGRL